MVMSRVGADVGSGRIEPARTNVTKKNAAGAGNREKIKLKERRERDKSGLPPSGTIRDVYDFDKFL